MKYMTRVVRKKRPKEPVENQEDIPKCRVGRPKRDPDAEPKKYETVYVPGYQTNITKKPKCDWQCYVRQRQISETNFTKHFKIEFCSSYKNSHK